MGKLPASVVKAMSSNLHLIRGHAQLGGTETSAAEGLGLPEASRGSKRSQCAFSTLSLYLVLDL